MKFLIKALSDSGGVISLALDATDESDANRQARARGCSNVLSLRPANSWQLQRLRGGQRFPLALFNQELLALLEAGLTLVESIEALAENDRASLSGGKAAQGMSSRIVARSLSGGQASTTMAGASARMRVGWLRSLRFDLLSRARARVPLPTLATFVPRKSRRHCEHSRRFEMWTRAWAR